MRFRVHSVVAVALLTALFAACATTEPAKPTSQEPRTTPDPCEVRAPTADETTAQLAHHRASMHAQMRRGELDQVIQHFHNIEALVNSVDRTADGYQDRLELESMYVRAVHARDFLLMRRDDPGHPAHPPVLPHWPVSPW